jgi:hypothetical protein
MMKPFQVILPKNGPTATDTQCFEKSITVQEAPVKDRNAGLIFRDKFAVEENHH